MNFRTAIVALSLLCALVWWHAIRPAPPRPPSAPAPASTGAEISVGPRSAQGPVATADPAPVAARHPSAPPAPAPQPEAGSDTRTVVSSACPTPPRVAAGEAPMQVPVPARITLPVVEDARLTPLAGFSIAARVLARENYRFGREADYSPVDLALGWARMDDLKVLSRLQISQGGRWYRYQWHGAPPIPPRDIVRNSANMHMIPADAAVADALDQIEVGQRVRIDGWLVEVRARDGWRWRSSLTRDDSGAGACELVYVCAVTRE